MRRLLHQDPAQVDFERRGFRLGPARSTLEAAGLAFLTGFNAANEARDVNDVSARIGTLPPDRWGFAYEGAGMAFAVHDVLTLSRGARLAALLDGPGRDYPHLIHVGAGWAFARMRLRPWAMPNALDPLLRWLSWDGYGFHQAFFATERALVGQRVEAGVTGVRLAVRDQGMGRALWFAECATADPIAARIACFPPERRGDLWSGVGLAATYAGGAGTDELVRLARQAGDYRAELAQGAAFACAARLRSGIVPVHTQVAVTVLAEVDHERASAWTDEAMRHVTPTAEGYQLWRAGIRRLWGSRRSVQS
ncbi:DUF1702 family protein [Nonomuraea sp. NPDC050556]|uniref:DUF1702 family protein n=1 Tax=Nonomuraea sp. NPDC050556 TaxID=3364369 RepID=UPI0037AE0460